jgi:predicted nucleic acid-binding protein
LDKLASVVLIIVAVNAGLSYNTVVIFCHMVIFDASTLILITRIDLLDPFLGILSMRTAIPAEVHRECCGAKKTLDALMIQKAVDDSRIQVVAVKDRKAVARMQEDFSLGTGEAEAIALALQSNARLGGVDDKNGINACRLLRLPFTTAAGILTLCRERNLIRRSEAADKLDLLAKYGRYKNSIVEDVRTQLEKYP